MRPRARRRALALVLTLWLVVLLTAMVYSLLWDVQVEIRLRRLAADDLQARWLARAGVAKAIADLANDMVIERSEDNRPLDALGDVWAMDNEDKTAVPVGAADRPRRGAGRRGEEIPGGTFTVRIEDAESRINLNNAPLELLMGLVIALGEEDEITARLRAEAIVDWRDENTQPVATTAEPGMQENEHWQTVLLDEEGSLWEGTMHNGRFLTVDELLSVPGIGPALFAGAEGPRPGRRADRGRPRGEASPVGLRDCVTVASSGMININTARREVLGALAIAALGPEADWEAVAEAIIEQRDGRRLDNPDDDMPFQTVEELANIPLAGGIASRQAQFHLDVRSQSFTIAAVGQAGEARHSVVAEVRRDWEAYLAVDMTDPGAVEDIIARAQGRIPAAREPDRRRADRGDRGGQGRRGEPDASGVLERPAVRILTWAEN